jgi:charged multivesicular body protein 1
MKTGDLVKIMGVMDKFEEQVGNLDQQEKMMVDSMGGAVATMTPESEIDSLLMQVGEEHSMDVSIALSSSIAGTAVPDAAAPVPVAKVQEDALSQRLAALRM